MNRTHLRSFIGISLFLAGCSSPASKENTSAVKQAEPPQPYFKVDPAAAGSIKGKIHFSGKRPGRTVVDMEQDPSCVMAHKAPTLDDSVVVSPNGALANVFVYVKSGLEHKRFEPPVEPVIIDQNGCWFRPRVIGIQTGQRLSVTNSDPVTHNIHPLAQINREWNHSQGPGDGPLARKFLQPEIMIKVKCNIHNWMHAYIGVVDHPYFAVTAADGSFTLGNIPAGEYTLEAWHEKFGSKQQKVTVNASGSTGVTFDFKGED